MRRCVVIAVVCLLLAGCVGGGVDTQPPASTETTESIETETSTPTPSKTQTEVDTARETFEPAPDNPWEADPVKVNIYRNDAPDRDYKPLVRKSLNFWENESQSGRVGYDLNYTFVDSSANADIIIGFVDEIDRCGGSHEAFAGCADYIETNADAPNPTIVEVSTIYDNDSTVTILKHEFGHTLGYTHSSYDIYGFMNETNVLAELDQPNIDERDYFWEKQKLKVYVAYNDSQREHPEGSRDDDVERVLEYYNQADELPDGVELTLTDSRSEADVVVEFRDELKDGYASSAYYSYEDPDRDGDPNYFVSYTILVGELGSKDAENHVGYQFAWALYANEESDVPSRYR